MNKELTLYTLEAPVIVLPAAVGGSIMRITPLELYAYNDDGKLKRVKGFADHLISGWTPTNTIHITTDEFNPEFHRTWFGREEFTQTYFIPTNVSVGKHALTIDGIQILFGHPVTDKNNRRHMGAKDSAVINCRQNLIFKQSNIFDHDILIGKTTKSKNTPSNFFRRKAQNAYYLLGENPSHLGKIKRYDLTI